MSHWTSSNHSVWSLVCFWFHLRHTKLFNFSEFQCTSQHLISLADIGWRINHRTGLICLRLQNVCVLNFDLCWEGGGMHPATSPSWLPPLAKTLCRPEKLQLEGPFDGGRPIARPLSARDNISTQNMDVLSCSCCNSYRRSAILVAGGSKTQFSSHLLTFWLNWTVAKLRPAQGRYTDVCL